MNISYPKTDTECWAKYPKYNWVYNMIRLLESQNIKWSPFQTNTLLHNIHPFTIGIEYIVPDTKPSGSMNDRIFIEPFAGDHKFANVIIQKGNIKWMNHYDHKTFTFSDNVSGNIELRINAFVKLYLTKFNGSISFETAGDNIYNIKLRPHEQLIENIPDEFTKIIKKIYN